MRKRERIFLETLVLSLAVIFMSTTMAHSIYASVFEMSPSEKICLEQRREKQEFVDRAGQDLSSTSMVLEFGLIRDTIGANGKISRWPTLILPADPKSITAQILLQPLPRASPP